MSMEVWPMRLITQEDAHPPRVLVLVPHWEHHDIELEVAYAKNAGEDSINRGEAPLVAFLMWGLWVESEDALFELMAPWAKVAEGVALYIDHHPPPELALVAATIAERIGVEVMVRSIFGEIETTPEAEDTEE